MNEGFYFILGATLSALSMSVIFRILETLGGPSLMEAQASYSHCLGDGAPQENCLKYLLPKEK